MQRDASSAAAYRRDVSAAQRDLLEAIRAFQAPSRPLAETSRKNRAVQVRWRGIRGGGRRSSGGHDPVSKHGPWDAARTSVEARREG